MPTVSIIVPVYNVVSYVDVCLASIAAQTYDDIEVIVVDDGSTDGSGGICDAWADRDGRFRVIHQENHGLSAARNVGLDMALGEYVQFVDSDDFVVARYTQMLLEYAQRYDCRCVICGYAARQAGGWKSYVPSAYPRAVGASESLELVLGTGLRDCFMVSYTVWNRIYKRSLFEESGIRFPEGRIYEDVCVIVPILRVSDVVVLVPDVLYYKNDREGSITYEISASKAWECVQAFETLCSDVERDFPDLQPLADRAAERSRVHGWLRLTESQVTRVDDAQADSLLGELRCSALLHRGDLRLPEDASYVIALALMGVSPRLAAWVYMTWQRLLGLVVKRI